MNNMKIVLLKSMDEICGMDRAFKQTHLLISFKNYFVCICWPESSSPFQLDSLEYFHLFVSEFDIVGQHQQLNMLITNKTGWKRCQVSRIEQLKYFNEFSTNENARTLWNSNSNRDLYGNCKQIYVRYVFNWIFKGAFYERKKNQTKYNFYRKLY